MLLAPLAIAEEERNRGKGAFLAEKALRRAAELGEEAVVLVGDPHFYNRLGFSELGGFGLKCNMEIPARYVLAKELVPGILKDVHGIVEIM